MKGAVVLSLVDQAVLSALSLAIGLLLIRLGTPETLGHFTLAMAVFFMFFSVKYALVTLPISTRLFGSSPADQAELLRVVCTFDLVLMAVSAVLAGLVLAAFGFAADQLLAAVAMVVAGLWRELARSVEIARGRMPECLRMDVAATALTLAALAGLWRFAAPDVACLLALAIGNAAAALLFGPRLHMAPRRLPELLRAYAAFLPLTRWSFVGGVTAELQGRGYVFMVQLLRGAAANGLLQASRILVSPVDLIGIAWARVMVPRLAALAREGRLRDAYALTRLNVGLVTAFALAYFAALAALWGEIERLVFDGRYSGVGEIVAAWAVFSVAAAQFRCLESLFQAMERFRELAVLGVANTVGVLGLMAVLAWPVPLYTVLAILTAGQVAVIAALLWLLAPAAQLETAP